MNSPNSSNRPFIVEKELSYLIIGAFYESYNDLGFGFSKVCMREGSIVLWQSADYECTGSILCRFSQRENSWAFSGWTCSSKTE